MKARPLQNVLRVDVPGGSYPVHITTAGLEGLGEAAAGVVRPGRCVVVTNPVVHSLYGPAAAKSLLKAGFAPQVIQIPDGERYKHVETWAQLVRDLVALGVDRQTPVVALGGGVTGDIVGFAAASVLRGLPLIQVPTTLLAMVDSAVGGKTAVNLPAGKNLVGAFHQPALVYAGLRTLQTLPVEEVTAGLGEVVKHALVGDLLLWKRLLHADGRDPAVLADCVRRSCALKAAIVAEDERERGRRVVLNFGHTVGHGIEAAMKGRLRHGHCVALGMLAELRYAASRGWTPLDLPNRVEMLLKRLGLPVVPPSNLDIDAVREAVRHDKKRARATLRTCAVAEIGTARIVELDPGEVDEMVHHLDAAAFTGKLIGVAVTVEDR